MRRWSQRAYKVSEEYQSIRYQALVIGRGRVSNPDGILVAAVLAGAPTTWLWAFPTIVQPDSSAAAIRVCRKMQGPWRARKRRAPRRRLHAIWRELTRLLRKLGDRWRP